VLYHVETRSYSVDILVLEVLTNCKKMRKGWFYMEQPILYLKLNNQGFSSYKILTGIKPDAW